MMGAIRVYLNLSPFGRAQVQLHKVISKLEVVGITRVYIRLLHNQMENRIETSEGPIGFVLLGECASLSLSYQTCS